MSELTTSELLAREIDVVVKDRLEKSSLDRTYEATIVRVLFNKDTLSTDENYNKYRVSFGNKTNGVRIEDIIIDDGNAHSVNEKVYIKTKKQQLNYEKIKIIVSGCHAGYSNGSKCTIESGD